MPDIDLAAIRARADAATPGPWEVGALSSVDSAEWGIAVCLGDDPGEGTGCREHRENAEFIAHARTDVPALLDLLAEQVTATRAVMDDRDAARAEERLRAEVLAATTSRLRGAEDALDAVRALHRPAPVYLLADECGHEDCDLIEGVDGSLCGDSPTGEQYCPECTHDVDDELTPYPCATIRAITPETTTTEGEDL